MTVSQFQSGKRQRTRRGVSLIEVLVVLVILVVGILTIIRLFPSGFFSIQSTGNAALANSLGGAAINLGEQNAQSLPEAILPDDLATTLYADNLTNAMMNASAYSNYDPDNPNNLENARVVTNETVTIPTLVRNQSVYPVNYGPVLMPKDPTDASTISSLTSYFTVNSPNWTAQSGSYAPAPIAGSTPIPTDRPQDSLVPGQERILVDLVSKRIAVPYAVYTPDGTTSMTSGTPALTVNNANSYAQKMVVVINYYDSSNNTYGTSTKYLNVPAGTPKNGSSPYAPFGSDGVTYLPDANVSGGSGYQGGWFDPANDYGDTTPGQSPPSTSTVSWVSVSLYRPYNGLTTRAAFDNDPYEFQLLSGNIVTNATTGANPGVVSFNPKAATGSGAQARKAQISYIVYSWSILREDHDIPALTGSGSTFAVRTTVPNLLLAGSANPDNSINPGIAGSSNSLLILDLDTGKIVAPGGLADPTNPDSPLNNEDVNGAMHDPKQIDVSYALGRLTFGSDAFGDNSSQTPTDGTGTAPAHRIRIFYTADLNWTVAVQKAPAYFSQPAQAGAVTGTTPLGADQFAYDATARAVYFARCNAGKTVEIDGTYTTTGATPTTQGFSDTVAVSQVLSSVGDSDVSVDLTDGTRFQYPVPSGATVVFGAVRGLSARSVVAWKERNVYKVHSVDTILNRTP